MSSLVSQQSLLHHDIDNLLPRGPLPSSYSEGSLQTLATTSQPKEKHRPNPVQVSRGRSRGNSSVSTQPSSPTRTLQTINENSSQDISNLTRAPLSRSVSPTKNSTYRASIEVAEDTSLIGRRSTEKSQGDAASARRPRSPLKKLFGEHGWLSKSSSMKDLGSDLSRPSHLQRLGNRLKGKVGDLVTYPASKLWILPLTRDRQSRSQSSSSNQSTLKSHLLHHSHPTSSSPSPKTPPTKPASTPSSSS